MGDLVKSDDFGRKARERVTRKPPTDVVFNIKLEDKWRVLTPLTPEDIANTLRAAEEGDPAAQMTLFEEMEENDACLSGFMQTRRNAPLGLETSVTPAKTKTEGDAARAQEVADYVDEVLSGITNWRESLVDFFDAIGKGLSAIEIHWREDGTIERLTHIHPSRYEFDRESGKLLIYADNVTGAPDKPIEPPMGKVIIHRSKLRAGHAARGGALRTVVWPYMVRNYATKDWSTYSETYGMPLRVGKYKQGANDQARADLARSVKNLGTDAAAIIADTTEIEFIEVNRGTGSSPYPEIFREMRSEYAFAILGQEGSNIQNKYGARADSEVKDLVRQDLLESDCVQGESTLKRDLIFWIVYFKFGWDVAVRFSPTYHWHYEPKKNRKEMIDVDQILLKPVSKGGLGLGRFVRREDVFKRYDMPMAPEGTKPEEMLLQESDELEPDPTDDTRDTEKPKPRPDSREKGQLPPKASRTDSRSSTKQLKRSTAEELALRYALRAANDDPQAAIDALVDKLTREAAEEAFAEIDATVRAIVSESEDMPDLLERLERAFDDLPQEALEEKLAQGMFAARLFGRAALADKASA